ncbi:MAG TPA: cysteine hydrolase [Candidatus Saccharimonadales bacterium]|nr:cysteine hydrolase [Candidatus Saccharimonadales bacterium]
MAQNVPLIQHPSGIDQKIVDKVVSRRERLYAFPVLNLSKTALVVIDLDMGTGRDDEVQVASISENINSLASALRSSGGRMAWVTTPMEKATDNFRAVFGDAFADLHEANGKSGKSDTIWPELEYRTDDIRVTKRGHSAFFPGKSDLHQRLQAEGVESILIVGAVTNVCCEASARDAAELQYKVTLISDALIGWSEEQSQATFATFFRCYGDVRPSVEMVQLIKEG